MNNQPSSSDTVYCRECGQEMLPENQFCGNCGAEQSADSSPQQQQSTPRNASRQSGKQPPPQQPQRQPPEGQPSSGEPRGASWKNLSVVSVGKKLSLGGTALIIAGAFLPWFSVQLLGSSVTRAGIDADGVITLLLAIIAMIVIARSQVRTWGRKTSVGVLIIGGLVTLLGLVYINDPWAFSEPPSEDAQQLVNIGIGLYLTALGGIMTIAGPLYDMYS